MLCPGPGPAHRTSATVEEVIDELLARLRGDPSTRPTAHSATGQPLAHRSRPLPQWTRSDTPFVALGSSGTVLTYRPLAGRAGQPALPLPRETDSGPRWNRSSGRDALQHVGVSLEVRVDRVHVVLVVERLDQPQHLAGRVLVELDARRRAHRQLGVLDVDALALQRLAHPLQVARRGDDLPDVLVLGDVFRAGVDRGHQVVLGVALRVDQHDALLLELPGDGARLAQRPAGLGEDVADLRARAIAVVGQRLDQERHAARAVALVDDRLEGVGVGVGAGALGDRALDVVLRHRVFLGLLDRVGQGRVALGVTAALLRRDLDRARELREQGAALRVLRALLMLDRAPLGVAGHSSNLAPTAARARPPRGGCARPAAPRHRVSPRALRPCAAAG